MPRQSAGLLLYRVQRGAVEVLLVHPGGPFWASRDAGVWSLPKGEYDESEEPLAAALREFREETGIDPPVGDAVELGESRQRSGKLVRAFALEGDVDAQRISSNTFEIEWPPRSGRRERFPEVDRGGWFKLEAAREKLVPGQVPFLDALQRALGGSA